MITSILFLLSAVLEPAEAIIEATPIEGIPVVATASAIVDAPELYQERFTPAEDATLAPDERRVVIGSAPIWYADKDTGELTRIALDAKADVDSVDGEASYSESRNTIGYECSAAGVSTFTVGPYILRTRLNEIRVQEGEKEPRATESTVKPSALTKDGDTISVDGFLPGVSVKAEIRPGEIKENIILDAVPDAALKEAEIVLFVFSTDIEKGATIIPTMEDADIVWRNNSDMPILRMRAPFVFDAVGVELKSWYVIEENGYAVAVDGLALAAASYPVTIDPSVTTIQGDATANRTTYSDLAFDINMRAFMKFTLPDLTGYVVSVATIQVNCVSVVGAAGFDVYCDVTGAWDESSTLATLEGLTFNASCSSQSVGATGTATFDILGNSAKGIRKIYTDDPSPAPGTVRFFNTENAAVPDAVGTIIATGNISDGIATFSDRTDATNFPRISITYSVGGTGRKGSGSAGMIMGMQPTTEHTEHTEGRAT